MFKSPPTVLGPFFTSIALGPEDSIFLMDAGSGHLLVLDTDGDTIEKVNVQKFLGDEQRQGQAWAPIAADDKGVVYFASTNALYTWQTGSTVKCFADGGVSDAGPGTGSVRSSVPSDLYWHSGLLYVVDRRFHCVRTVDAQGAVRIVAGNGALFGSGDGSPATEAGLWLPHCVEVKSDGSLWIGCGRTSAFVIRRVDPSGSISTHHAEAWYQNAPEDWAEFWTPWKAQEWDSHALDVRSLESQGVTIQRERKQPPNAATTWMREPRETRLRDGSRLVIMSETQLVRIEPGFEGDQTVLFDRTESGLEV